MWSNSPFLSWPSENCLYAVAIARSEYVCCSILNWIIFLLWMISNPFIAEVLLPNIIVQLVSSRDQHDLATALSAPNCKLTARLWLTLSTNDYPPSLGLRIRSSRVWGGQHLQDSCNGITHSWGPPSLDLTPSKHPSGRPRWTLFFSSINPGTAIRGGK